MHSHCTADAVLVALLPPILFVYYTYTYVIMRNILYAFVDDSLYDKVFNSFSNPRVESETYNNICIIFDDILSIQQYVFFFFFTRFVLRMQLCCS